MPKINGEMLVSLNIISAARTQNNINSFKISYAMVSMYLDTNLEN